METPLVASESFALALMNRSGMIAGRLGVPASVLTTMAKQTAKTTTKTV